MFFSLGTIGLSRVGGRKPSTLLQAVRHNQRSQQAERGARAHIAPSLTHLNEHLCGPVTPEGVAALASDLMTSAGVEVDKLRRDHTQAIELVFSLPPNTAIDTGAYFRRCVDWAGMQFGAANILSADIHRDEAAPHVHVLLLPLVDGRMNAKAMKTRTELARLRETFGREVAKTFGLKAPGRVDGAARGAAVRAVLARLQSSADPVLTSPLWQTVRRNIQRDPMPYVESLGLEVVKPERRTRSFASIMTGKGRSTSEDRQGREATALARAIAFEVSDDAKAIAFGGEKEQRLSCVAFAEITAPNKPLEPACDGVPDVGGGMQADDSAARKPTAPKRPTKASQLVKSDTPDSLRASMEAARRMGPAALELWHTSASEVCPDGLPGTGGGGGCQHGMSTAEDRPEVVERDGDHTAVQWCEEIGEFIPAPQRKAMLAREAADRWTAAQLATRRNMTGNNATAKQRQNGPHSGRAGLGLG